MNIDIPGEFTLKRPDKLPQPPAPRFSLLDSKPSTRTSPGIDAITAWQKSPDPDSAAVMLKSIQPTLDKALRKYVPQEAASPTLRSHAKRLALDELVGYDASKAGVDSYLIPRLQRLQRLAVQQSNIIGVPERVLMERQQLNSAVSDFTDKNGRPPSTAELADFTGLSVKRISHIRKAQLPLAESQATGTDESGDPLYPAVERQQTSAAAEFVYDSIDDDRDRFILEYSLGLHGQERKSLGEIAKLLGITPGAISQRANKIQMQIDDVEQAGLF